MAEQEIKKVEGNPEGKKPGPQKLVQIVFYILSMGFILYYLIMSSIAPVRFTKGINNMYRPDSITLASLDSRFLADSQFVAITQKIALTGARSKMSAGDSIGLFVNLKDSTIILEINGVTLRKIPVISYKIPGSLAGIESYQLTKFLEEPLTVESSEATIPKEPLMVKIAPRDTIEALSLPVITPDTTGIDPVCFRLTLNNDIKLTVIQDVTDGGYEETARKRFMFREAVKTTSAGLKQALGFKVPVYEPDVVIVVSKDDARVLYRALPVNSMVVLLLR